jgi:hypothetical protein
VIWTPAPRKTKAALVFHHLGMGDHIICAGLVRQLAQVLSMCVCVRACARMSVPPFLPLSVVFLWCIAQERVAWRRRVISNKFGREEGRDGERELKGGGWGGWGAGRETEKQAASYSIPRAHLFPNPPTHPKPKPQTSISKPMILARRRNPDGTYPPSHVKHGGTRPRVQYNPL